VELCNIKPIQFLVDVTQRHGQVVFLLHVGAPRFKSRLSWLRIFIFLSSFRQMF